MRSPGKFPSEKNCPPSNPAGLMLSAVLQVSSISLLCPWLLRLAADADTTGSQPSGWSHFFLRR